MQMKRMIVALTMAGIVALSATARAETASESFSQGKKLLAKGEFDAALNSYSAAARADRKNQEYAQRYAMVRRDRRSSQSFGCGNETATMGVHGQGIASVLRERADLP